MSLRWALAVLLFSCLLLLVVLLPCADAVSPHFSSQPSPPLSPPSSPSSPHAARVFYEDLVDPSTGQPRAGLTLTNGLFSTTFDVATGTEVSWKAPHLSDIDLLAEGGHASWNNMDYEPSGMEHSVLVNTSQLVHVRFSEPANATRGHPNVPYFEWEFHYVVVQGLTGMYTWSVFQRNSTVVPRAHAGYTIVEYRYVVRLSVGTEQRNYTDQPFDRVRISDALNTDRRQPNYYQALHGQSGLPGMPKEVELVTYDDGTQEFVCKYDLILGSLEHQVFGWYHSKTALGIWLITPDFSYKNGNWMNQELTAYGPTTGTGSLFCIIQYVAGEHYGSGEQPVPLDSTGWKKTYGPFLIYANKGSDGQATWDDAMAQYRKEVDLWPYTFVQDPQYAESNRGSVTGSLLLPKSEIGPEAPGLAGTLVVLSQPEATDGELQSQSARYWYFNYTDAQGHFEIHHVLPDTYELHVWKNGTLGNYTHPQLLHVTKGGDQVDAGSITWTPMRYGPTVWELGRPDHDSQEFRNGYLARYWDLYDRYSASFPNGVHYRMDMSLPREAQIQQWAREWNFEHVPVSSGSGMRDTTWTLSFNSTQQTQQAQQVALRIGFAGVVRCGVEVGLNGATIASWMDLKTWADNSVYRDGSRGQYTQKEVNVSTSTLAPLGAANNLTFTTACPTEMDGVMYDYIRMEAIGSAAALAVDGLNASHPPSTSDSPSPSSISEALQRRRSQRHSSA